MTPRNNYSPIPFYDDIKYQDFRKWWSYGNIYPLIVPNNKINPYQIQLPYNKLTTVTNTELLDLDGNVVIGSVSLIYYAQHFEDEQITVISQLSINELTTPLPIGQYYLHVQGNQSGVRFDKYSEVITVVNDIENFLKIEFENDEYIKAEDNQIINFVKPFRGIIYLKADLGKPDYEQTNTSEDRDGIKFWEKQISEKVFRCNDILPEYLLDCLRIVPLCDYIRLTNDNLVYNVNDMLVTPSWEEQGNLANTEFEFRCDTVIVKNTKVVRGKMSEFSGGLELTYDINSSSNLTLTLPSLENGQKNITVDWGDGTTQTFTSGYLQHTYTSLGEYKVIVTGEIREFTAQGNVGPYNPHRQSLVSIDSWGYGLNVMNMNYAFFNCTRLSYVAYDPLGVFWSTINTAAYTFSGCSNLTEIPEGLFINSTMLQTAQAMFSSSGLTSIDGNMLVNCTAINNVANMFAMTKITSIPQTLFNNCTAITTINYCFNGCTNLTAIPADIFIRNTNTTTAIGVYQNCSNATSISFAALRGLTNVVNASLMFNGCSSVKTVSYSVTLPLSSATDISYFFGSTGLTSVEESIFNTNVNVVNMGYVFYNCKSLASIPANIFANNVNVTSFEGTFYGCSALTTIPTGLFANNVNVTSFLQTFRTCTGLSAITSDMQLFTYNTNVTTFQYTFMGCTGLASVDPFIFRYNNKVTNVTGLFQDCRSLRILDQGSPGYLFYWMPDCRFFSNVFSNNTSVTSIPANIFQNNSNAEYIDSAFLGCSNVTTVADNLFAPLTKVINANSLFNGCSSLKNISSNLLNGLSSVTNAAGMFNGCMAITDLPNGLLAPLTSLTLATSMFSSISISDIPNDLLSYTNNITTVNSMFSQCGLLQSIPNNLFDNNKNIANFGYCFRNCISVMSSTPTGSDNRQLWNRAGATGYPSTIEGVGCFAGAINISNYNSIPSNWGGPA